MSSHNFEQAIGYRFRNGNLLKEALTHSSYTNDGRPSGERNNERLEFLGDAFFDAVISEYLYNRMTGVEEGSLTKLRALVVCERSLAERGRYLSVGEHIRLGRGEENSGGRDRPSIIADAMEAVIAAVYLDGGWDAARDLVLRIFQPTIEDALAGKLHKDFKTALQEKLQAEGIVDIRYVTEREEGPDHDKVFYVSLFAGERKIGEGSGRSKKEAEQSAAQAALEA